MKYCYRGSNYSGRFQDSGKVLSSIPAYGIDIMGIRKYSRNLVGALDYLRIGDRGFALVSNNCWGNEAYSSLGRPYNTPFVGLFLFPECYLKLLRNLENYLTKKLVLTNFSRYFDTPRDYPVGHLDESIEIHFLHYRSEEEAMQKWERRSLRLVESIQEGVPTFVKMCDREGCTSHQLLRFHDLPFDNKISMGIGRFPSKNHCYIPQLKSATEDSVIDGLSLFRRRYRYFDFAHWIKGGQPKQTRLSSALSLLS